MLLRDYTALVNAWLEKSITGEYGLAPSMLYSLMAGGKRIRPVLTLEFSRLSGGSIEKTLPVACAIEMIHTYSLIHDDLPCMDNDALRRGKPTNHIVFGESTATLAGDALQSLAFSAIMHSELPDAAKVKCAAILADAAGYRGMCQGQYLDIEAEGRRLSASELDEVNAHKTGALLGAACMIGVAAAGGSDAQMKAAKTFGRKLGLAFQIRDDVLDVISSSDVLGKPVGSDAKEEKNTYMELFGHEECDRRVRELTAEAISALESGFEDVHLLKELALSLEKRMN